MSAHLCDLCQQQPATFHVTQLDACAKGGEKHVESLSLCQSCVRKNEINPEHKYIDMADIIGEQQLTEQLQAIADAKDASEGSFPDHNDFAALDDLLEQQLETSELSNDEQEMLAQEASELEAILGANKKADPSSALQNTSNSTEIACSHCGTTSSPPFTTNRMGCQHEYDLHGETIIHILEQIHENSHHLGRRPENAPDNPVERVLAHRILLEKQLKQAISEENYEEAARIRDALQALDA